MKICQYTCMNKAKVTDYDYIDFIIGTQKVHSCTEAERVNPKNSFGPSHDAYTRQPHRLFPTTDRLSEPRFMSTLKKDIRLLTTVLRINFTVVKSSRQPVIGRANTNGLFAVSACRFCYGLMAGGIFRSIAGSAISLLTVRRKMIIFATCYSSPDNLKLIRLLGRCRMTRLKDNRLINPDRSGNIAVSQAEISEQVDIVHLKGYGMIKVFRTVGTDDGAEYRAANDLKMNDLERLNYSEISRMVETYRRGVKQFRGIERCQARSGRTQRNHIESALRAFLRIEYHHFVKGLSRFEAKTSIIRDAVRAYPAHPIYTLDPIKLYPTA